jgi:hypothetical protein
MPVKVSLSELVAALECAADEISTYVNVATGEVITVTHEDLRAAEADADPDMPDWQRETIAEAKRVLELDEWIEAPSKSEINEWKTMDLFGDSLPDEAQREEVRRAIRGSGAFRQFKVTIRHWGIEHAWFEFKRCHIEGIARAWLSARGLEVGGAVPPAVLADDASRRR